MRNGVRVLFVQHPFKNAPASALQSGSIVACARSFGNCDVATKGGIPEVVPFWSFASSPSRSCGCVRRRDVAWRRVEGTRGPTPGCFTQRIRNLP